MDNDIEHFKTMTGANTETARFCLQSCDGDMEAAVFMYNNTPELQGPGAQVGERQENRQQEDSEHVIPLGVVTAEGVDGIVAELSFRDMDDALQADAFVRSFTRHYGAQHPTFVEMGWKEAARQADRQSRFLFVYLHAPEHEDTESFCRHVLSSNEVVIYLDRNFVCWGGSIDRPSASSLARDAGAATFPFICLLGHYNDQVTVMASIQGKVPGIELLGVLQQSLEEQGSVLVAQRAERHQREADRQLRQDQDREYQRALEADRERDRRNREAAAARAAIEEEARQIAEQERLAKEAEEQRKQEHQGAIVRRRTEKAANLKPEPFETSGIVQLRVRLPDGSTYTRKFLESDKVSAVYDFVDGLEGLHCWDYTLASSYPKIEFGIETRGMTLVEMGVEHSATLLVQSHDD